MKTIKEKYDFIREIAEKIESGEIKLDAEKAGTAVNELSAFLYQALIPFKLF